MPRYNCITVGELKKIINDLPDDMPVLSDDTEDGAFDVEKATVRTGKLVKRDWDSNPWVCGFPPNLPDFSNSPDVLYLYLE